MSQGLTVIDLFAGVGGFTLGFLTAALDAKAIYDVRLLADIDEEAADTFKRNFPAIPFLVADLSRTSSDALRKAARLEGRDLDVLIGGPPCQGLSRLKRWTPEDPRNARIGDFARLVLDLQPRLFVMENVPTLLGQTGSALLGRFRATVSRDYEVECGLVKANEYGVPQLRQRTIVVGHRKAAGLGTPRVPGGYMGQLPHPRALIPVGEGGGGEIERIAGHYVTVEDAIGDLPALSSGGGSETMMYASRPCTDYQRERRRGARLLFNHKARNHSVSFLEKIRVIEEGSRNQELTDAARFSDGYFSQAYARLHRQGIAQTITTYFTNPGSGRFTHYRDLRAMTVREAARLQSFDDTFRFFGPLETQQRHVGNAVPPLMARALAASLCAPLCGQVADACTYRLEGHG